jgi:PTH1 family peptidyl-tRNA hydrolase
MADVLVVGLGNPGEEYARSRHNLGAEVVAELAARHGGRLKLAKKERALTTEVTIAGRRVALAFPQTYMNDSGQSVQLLRRRYDIEDPADIVIVHDELDLPVGRMKLKEGGGLAGHNGLRSLKQHLHTDAFLRSASAWASRRPRSEGDHVLRRVEGGTHGAGHQGPGGGRRGGGDRRRRHGRRHDEVQRALADEMLVAAGLNSIRR